MIALGESDFLFTSSQLPYPYSSFPYLSLPLDTLVTTSSFDSVHYPLNEVPHACWSDILMGFLESVLTRESSGRARWVSIDDPILTWKDPVCEKCGVEHDGPYGECDECHKNKLVTHDLPGREWNEKLFNVMHPFIPPHRLNHYRFRGFHSLNQSSWHFGGESRERFDSIILPSHELGSFIDPVPLTDDVRFTFAMKYEYDGEINCLLGSDEERTFPFTVRKWTRDNRLSMEEMLMFVLTGVVPSRYRGEGDFPFSFPTFKRFVSWEEEGIIQERSSRKEFSDDRFVFKKEVLNCWWTVEDDPRTRVVRYKRDIWYLNREKFGIMVKSFPSVKRFWIFDAERRIDWLYEMKFPFPFKNPILHPILHRVYHFHSELHFNLPRDISRPRFDYTTNDNPFGAPLIVYEELEEDKKGVYDFKPLINWSSTRKMSFPERFMYGGGEVESGLPFF
ncbi:hypothetical protein D9758_017483 [Tetrapyrgos nigripes]|uniref:Uncharacterized protein n=1 Tax=Tetrapyrgos nigripes TaxID=182062 RepID=A0A8H5C429_9AGAR|nr:hypothetical protein D9758_017483 [Tetrapyrgos nigripes]